MFDYSPIILSLKLAFITATLTTIIATPLAWLTSYHNFRGKVLLRTIINIPMFLPPTVLGFYFLIVFSPNGIFGDLNLAFSFKGLIIASIIFNLPFMYQPLEIAFKGLSEQYFEEAILMQANKINILQHIIIPLCYKAYASAFILGISHTMSEFGLLLMIGGNIPNQTKVASIAIYDSLNKLDFNSAHINAFILFSVSFAITYIIHKITNYNK